MNYGQFVRFAEKNWHLGADKLTQITVFGILYSAGPKKYSTKSTICIASHKNLLFSITCDLSDPTENLKFETMI